MSSESGAPLRRLWDRMRDRAPRQKTLATITASVRRTKPRTAEQARQRLIGQAARRGITDLSDKELQVMVDGVVTSAKDATTQAISKGTSSVRAMWASLQQTSPEWTELPDNVAALNARSGQASIPVSVEIDAPDVLRRLHAELPAERDDTRSVNCVLSVADNGTVLVEVGRTLVGRVPEYQAELVRDVLAHRRAWVPAAVHGADPETATLTVELPG
jgi:hypothetical protein